MAECLYCGRDVAIGLRGWFLWNDPQFNWDARYVCTNPAGHGPYIADGLTATCHMCGLEITLHEDHEMWFDVWFCAGSGYGCPATGLDQPHRPSLSSMRKCLLEMEADFR